MAKDIQQLDLFVQNMMQDEVVKQEQTFQAFTVSDLETAAEAQRRIAYFKEQMAELDAIAEKQIEPFQEKIDRIKEWSEQAKQEYIEKSAHYSLLLENFIREQVAEQQASGKKLKKTIKLPYGTIALKKQQPEFTKDAEALLEYAKSVEMVKVKEEADWAAIKKVSRIHEGKMYDQNGEVIPGVSVFERDDKFEIKLDGVTK